MFVGGKGEGRRKRTPGKGGEVVRDERGELLLEDGAKKAYNFNVGSGMAFKAGSFTLRIHLTTPPVVIPSFLPSRRATHVAAMVLKFPKKVGGKPFRRYRLGIPIGMSDQFRQWAPSRF